MNLQFRHSGESRSPEAAARLIPNNGSKEIRHWIPVFTGMTGTKPPICDSPANIARTIAKWLSQAPVILSAAKNPWRGKRTLRFAQSDRVNFAIVLPPGGGIAKLRKSYQHLQY